MLVYAVPLRAGVVKSQVVKSKLCDCLWVWFNLFLIFSMPGRRSKKRIGPFRKRHVEVNSQAGSESISLLDKVYKLCQAMKTMSVTVIIEY